VQRRANSTGQKAMRGARTCRPRPRGKRRRCVRTARRCRRSTHPAAYAVLVANYHPKLCANLITALAYLHVRNLARRSGLEAESTRKKRSGKSALVFRKRNKYLRVAVWHGKQEIPVMHPPVCITGMFVLQNRMPRKTGLIAPIRIFQCFFKELCWEWDVD
jgi:hypothetical protein